MRKAAFWLMLFASVGVLTCSTPNTQASPVILNFSLTLDGNFGTGDSKPGMVPGAEITGSYAWNTEDFHPVAIGSVTVYDDPYSVLTYTATIGGSSYTYSFSGVAQANVYAPGPGQTSVFAVQSGFTELQKNFFNFPGNSSLNSFFTAMSYGLTGGQAYFTDYDNGSTNGTGGFLSSLSLTQVPEPSEMSLACLGLIGVWFIRRGRSRCCG